MVHVLGMELILPSNKKLIRIITPTLIYVRPIVILNIHIKVLNHIRNSREMIRLIGLKLRNGKSMR